MNISELADQELLDLADEIRVVLAKRRWSVGDKCFWRDRIGVVHQGTVRAILRTGLLGVAKKGELQWGNAVDPVCARKTMEAACAAVPTLASDVARMSTEACRIALAHAKDCDREKDDLGEDYFDVRMMKEAVAFAKAAGIT